MAAAKDKDKDDVQVEGRDGDMLVVVAPIGVEVTIDAALLDSYVSAGYYVKTDAAPVVVPHGPLPVDAGDAGEPAGAVQAED